MSKLTIQAALLATLSLVALAPSARADSADAMCEVRMDGETKRGKSGPCTFSQRQGYINLDLRNGDTYSLSPGNKSNHYRDQKNRKVFRAVNGRSEEFKWEDGRKIIVTFASNASAQNRPAAAASLSDLIGAKASSADSDLRARGFSDKGGYKQGDQSVVLWYNPGTRQCVRSVTANGRIQSIGNIGEGNCR